MVDSRCGLHCTGCAWKESHGCGGCIETDGHPFHGTCPIAHCCADRGHVHCGQCGENPCQRLYDYSFVDPEHGDKPIGARVRTLRAWAAEEGVNAFSGVLLTSAGLSGDDGALKPNAVRCLLSMLPCAPQAARVLFITAAAIHADALHMVELCKQELLDVGFAAQNIDECRLDTPVQLQDAMQYDMVYVTGGDTGHLLTRMQETGFDAIVKRMVHAGKVYVGVSAGSIIATPNIGDVSNHDTQGLCFLHAFLSVHCAPGTQAREDLPLPHIPLNDAQALRVSWMGYALIEK